MKKLWNLGNACKESTPTHLFTYKKNKVNQEAPSKCCRQAESALHSPKGHLAGRACCCQHRAPACSQAGSRGHAGPWHTRVALWPSQAMHCHYRCEAATEEKYVWTTNRHSSAAWKETCRLLNAHLLLISAPTLFTPTQFSSLNWENVALDLIAIFL